jgi:hypothetical protein
MTGMSITTTAGTKATATATMGRTEATTTVMTAITEPT